MKRYFFVLFFFIALQCEAQTSRTVTRLDQNTVVKDENGTELTYEAWKKIVAGGEHSLKPITPGSAVFLLYKMSPEEKARNEARKKAQLASLPRPSASDVFKEGQKFQGDRFTSITGEKFDLKTTGEKVYVLNFWFINCPPCKREIPELNKIVEKYKGQDVVFIGIALDGKSDLKKFLESTPFNYQIVADGSSYSSRYGITGYPTNVVVGKDGLIKFSTTGLAPNTVHWIDQTIKEQLEAK